MATSPFGMREQLKTRRRIRRRGVALPATVEEYTRPRRLFIVAMACTGGVVRHTLGTLGGPSRAIRRRLLWSVV